MLKVVGASWYKTKLSSMIILTALVLAIGALFILNIERPRQENVYCATTFFTPSTGYRVEFWGLGHMLKEVPKGVARICYKGASSDADWPHMEIESDGAYSDRVQAFSAGILEGSLLWKSIFQQWKETIVAPCALEENVAFCAWLRKSLTQNYDSYKEKCRHQLNGHMDNYWYQIHLFYQQLEGLEFGWRHGLRRSPLRRSGYEIPIVDLIILNLGADLKLFEEHYNGAVRDADAPTIQFATRHRQTIQLSLEQDAEQRINLSMDHLLHDTVQSPHRILKKYKMNYRQTTTGHFGKQNTVPGLEIVLTSSPGVISSSDGFYAITGLHSRLTVAGIDILYNPQEGSGLDVQNFVFLGARVMAANRLATSSRSWAKLMKRDPYSAKQWILVDRKVLRSYNLYVAEAMQQNSVEVVSMNQIDGGEGAEKEKNSKQSDGVAGIIWVVDNVPGRLHGEDVTALTVMGAKRLHLAGLPHFRETLDESGLSSGNGADPEFEYLKQAPAADDAEPRHSLRFYALSSGRTDYAEGLTVIHSSDGDDGRVVGGAEDQEEGAGIGGGSGAEVGLVEDEDRAPTLAMAGGFFSKWTWV